MTDINKENIYFDDEDNSISLHSKTNAENHWFTTVVLLGTGFGSLYYFVNAWNWTLVKEASLFKTNSSVNDNFDEDTLYLIDIILGSVLFAIFIWCLLRLYFSYYPYEFAGYE